MDKLSMSLDDIIVKNKKQRPVKTNTKHVKQRNQQYKQKPKQVQKQKKQQQPPRSRLFISNLHSGLGNEEFRQLFEPFGALSRSGINWDHLGRSKTNGIIEFVDRADAEKAMQELEGKEVMGQAISIKFSR